MNDPAIDAPRREGRARVWLAKSANLVRPFLESERAALVLCTLAGLIAFLPYLLVKYPPAQDFPFHAATLRIIHSLHDPKFAFDKSFDVHLLGTPYVVFYLLGDLLTYPFGVHGAVLFLIGIYIVGTVLGVRALLRALGNDERLALLAAPLTVNCLTIMGFFPFLLGVTLLLFGLAAAVRYFKAPTTRNGVVLAALAVVLFFTHIIPLGLLICGAALFFPWFPINLRQYARAGAPFVPVGALLVHWLLFTESGRFVRQGVADQTSDRWRFDESVHNLYFVTFDMFPDSGDERTFVVTIGCALLAAVLAAPQAERSWWRWRWAPIPLAALVLYFFSEGSVGYTGFLRDRLPIIAIFCAIPLLRFPSGWKGHFIAFCMLVATALSTETNLWHFKRFNKVEVADFDRALDLIPPNKRVMGLVFASSSEYIVRFPFLHFASYYQAEKGGIVQYSFAGIPHWLFKFKPHEAPPLTTPKRKWWEWDPASVSFEEETSLYYDYVIVRSEHPKAPPRDFRVLYESGAWTIWERRVL